MAKLVQGGQSGNGWSKIGTFLQCPQKYAYTYLNRSEKKNNTINPLLIKGILVHTGLAQLYKRMQSVQNGGDPNEWYAPDVAMYMQCESETPLWFEHFDECKDIVDKYFAHWNCDWKVIDVENAIQAKIGDSVYTGRCDLVIEDENGLYWIVDHKTTTEITTEQQYFYSMSGQLIGYAYMGNLTYGEKFAGIILNQIQYTNGMAFERIKLPKYPSLLNKYPLTIQWAEEQIKQLQEKNTPMSNYPSVMNEFVCYNRYGACPHIAKCQNK
jgi:hypothetical protein